MDGNKSIFNLRLHGGLFSLNSQLSTVKGIFVLHAPFDQSGFGTCEYTSYSNISPHFWLNSVFSSTQLAIFPHALYKEHAANMRVVCHRPSTQAH